MYYPPVLVERAGQEEACSVAGSLPIAAAAAEAVTAASEVPTVVAVVEVEAHTLCSAVDTLHRAQH